MFSNLILRLSCANVVIGHSENELERKSASLDIAEDQMFPNLILRSSLTSVDIRHCDNELGRLERDGWDEQGSGVGSWELGVGFRDKLEKILSRYLDY
jgi:hypothetical protein